MLLKGLLYIFSNVFLAHNNRHTLIDTSAMRQMMGKDAASASYFLLVKNGNSATSPLTQNTFPPS